MNTRQFSLLKYVMRALTKRADLINNHTCANINSDSCNGLIIMGGIYLETVIYSPYFVMEIKQFCTSKTMSSSVPPQLTAVPITGHILRHETCDKNNAVLQTGFWMWVASCEGYHFMPCNHHSWKGMTTDNCALISPCLPVGCWSFWILQH